MKSQVVFIYLQRNIIHELIMITQTDPFEEPKDILNVRGYDNTIKSLNYFFHSDDIHYGFKSRFKLAINVYWKLGYKKNGEIEMDEKDYNIIIMSFINYLSKNNFEKLNCLRKNAEKNKKYFVEYVQDNFMFYLLERETFKDERKKLYKMLKDAENLRPEEREEKLNEFFINNEQIIDKKVKKKIDTLIAEFDININNDEYKNIFEEKQFKKKVKDALCVHPEKILEAYDFTNRLEEWYVKTASQEAINLIGDIMLVDRLQKHDKYFIEKIFYSEKSKYRKAIEKTIRDKWEAENNDKSITAVIDTYLCYLLKRSQLSKIKSRMVSRVQYHSLIIDPYTEYIQDYHTPSTWNRYDLGANLLNLIEKSSRSYISDNKRKEYKDERIKLNNLLYEFDPVTVIYDLWHKNEKNYQKRITRFLKRLKKIDNYGLVQDFDTIVSVDDMMKQLRSFLCEDYKNRLVEYDFSMPFDEWIDNLVSLFIRNYPKKELLLKDNSGESFNVFFMKEMDRRIYYLIRKFPKKRSTLVKDTSSDNDENNEEFMGVDNNKQHTHFENRKEFKEVKDYKQDIQLVLLNNKPKLEKLLNNYRYQGDLRHYFSEIIYHDLSKEAKKENKEDKKEKKTKGSDIITRKEKTRTLGNLIKMLIESEEVSYYFGINRKSRDFTEGLLIIMEIYVNLTEFTSKEQSSKRKELIKFYTKEGKKGDVYRNVYEKRGWDILLDVLRKYIELKVNPNPTKEEKEILSKFNSLSEGGDLMKDLFIISDFLKLGKRAKTISKEQNVKEGKLH